MATRARTPDDRDSVASNVEQLGLYGAMRWAADQLPHAVHQPDKRRMLIMTVHHCARELRKECRRAHSLARAHGAGLRMQNAGGTGGAT